MRQFYYYRVYIKIKFNVLFVKQKYKLIYILIDLFKMKQNLKIRKYIFD